MYKGEGHNAMITANDFRDRACGTLQYTSAAKHIAHVHSRDPTYTEGDTNIIFF